MNLTQQLQQAKNEINYLQEDRDFEQDRADNLEIRYEKEVNELQDKLRGEIHFTNKLSTEIDKLKEIIMRQNTVIGSLSQTISVAVGDEYD